jgi:hypothetical protein
MRSFGDSVSVSSRSLLWVRPALPCHLPPYLVAKPLESLACVGELARFERGGMVGEMTRQLNHLIKQLAKNDVLTTLGSLRH